MFPCPFFNFENMSTFEEFKKITLDTFRKAKHPNDVLRDAKMVAEISRWYEKIFFVPIGLRNCGVCLYEKYIEMINLTKSQIESRLNLKQIIKKDTVVYHKGIHYSRKSPHLTDALMEEIAKDFPGKVEDNPNYIAPEIIEQPKKRRSKKISNE